MHLKYLEKVKIPLKYYKIIILSFHSSMIKYIMVRKQNKTKIIIPS